MDEVAGGLQNLLRIDRLAALFGLLHLGLVDFDGNIAPVAIEGGNEFAIGMGRPVGAGPARSGGAAGNIVGLVLEAGKETAPAFIDALRVVRIGGVEVLNIVGIAAI